MYLDNAATTKVHPKVIAQMQKIGYANYNAMYYQEAVLVKKQIDEAIDATATLLHVKVEQLVFTSSATESNNYIIKGVVAKISEGHYITSTIEHKSVLAVFKELEARGEDVTYLNPNQYGEITLKNVEDNIKSNTKFVSIMAVNNETGVINDVTQIARFLRSKKILFHTDIVQGLGKLQYDLSLFDYISISGHKISGPKGIGLAIINLEHIPQPLIIGSEQQNNNRAGTLPNELVIGLCMAIKLAMTKLKSNQEALALQKKAFIDFLETNLKDQYTINFTQNVVDSIVSVRIFGQINQMFLHSNSEILKASTGSSCSINQPSYVLKSCNFTDEMIQETVRFSFSPYEKFLIK